MGMPALTTVSYFTPGSSASSGISAAWENDALRRLLHYEGGASTLLLVGPGDALNPTGLGHWAVWRSDVDIWGGGIAQGIDSAAMILYLTYRHVRGDLELRQLQDGVATGPIADAPIDDLDLLLAGAVIRFWALGKLNPRT